MQHLIAMGVKFIAVTAVLWIIFILTGGLFTFNEILLTAAVITVLSYPGDLFIMPRLRNLTASITDAVLAFIFIAAVSVLLGYSFNEIILSAVIAALVIGAFEYPYHLYLKRNILTKNTWMPELTSKK